MLNQSLSSHAYSGVCPLPQWGVIAARGPDAAAFLQGQLSNDFLLLGHEQARLAAYCSPKGRMLASFIGFRRPVSDGQDPEILLITPANILPTTLKRLSMFVLRAKLKLCDASAEFSITGWTGEALATKLSKSELSTCKTWDLKQLQESSLIVLPPALNQMRGMLVSPVHAASEPSLQGNVSLDQWQYLDVMSAVAHINQATVDSFVPQMLNYESVGGVNFKKGCYPGQEVVARSQFRGVIKRRAYLIQGDVPLSAGQEVWPSDATEPVGSIAQSAQKPNSTQWFAIASLQTAAAQNETLYVQGEHEKTLLKFLPMPYELLSDV
jgi:tRNA-modifying protein YgfZ